MNSLPFQPGDWVKVIRKPKNAIAISKGDIIQVEQVSPSRQMIRIGDPDVGWEYLSFDEVELTLPPPKPVVTERQKNLMFHHLLKRSTKSKQS